MPATHPLILRAADVESSLTPFSHPWNPNSQALGAVLGRKLGLEDAGVNLVRLPAGRESFVPHSHTTEEEWIYVLGGHGAAWIDGVEYPIGPGDFLAFPVPSVAHQLKANAGEDLTYLVGGTHREVEIADFPTLGRRMVRRGEDVQVYPLDAARPFP